MMQQLIIKRGVDISMLRPEITRIIWPVADVFFLRGLDCVITSAMRNGDKRLHGVGLAIDVRGRHVPEEDYLTVWQEIIDACGGKEPYDIVHYENADRQYHIEYDPKVKSYA
jgi:hypothetical protein